MPDPAAPTPLASKVIRLEALKLMAEPLRVRLVEATVDRARTVKELAAQFGLPPTRLYYHINLLEKHGFVQVVETRLVSGIVEKHYRATARQYRVDRGPLADPQTDGQAGLEAVLGVVLDATRADIQKSARAGRIDLSQTAPEPQTLLIQRGVSRLAPAQARRFYRRLAALIADFTASPAADHDELYAIAVALYPTSYPPEDPRD